MSRIRFIAPWIAGLALFGVALSSATPALAAPYAAGNRIFPATPTTEDPFVASEVAFGTTFLPHGAGDSGSAFDETRLGSGFDLRLTDNLGIGLEDDYVIQDPNHESNRYGFDNLEAHIKYQFYVNDEHELLLSAAVIHEFGDTGARRIGAEEIGSTTPTFYFAKGFGDLPEDVKYLRPLAITGSFGYQIADERSHRTTSIDPLTGVTSIGEDHSPNFLVVGGALEYSLKYLQGNVEYLDLPRIIGRLIPLVEFTYETPATKPYGEKPQALIAPGVIYSDIGFDLGAEALVPLTNETGTGVGGVVKLTVFLDRVMPPLLDSLSYDR